MNRFSIFMAALGMAFALSACGSSPTEPTSSTDTAASANPRTVFEGTLSVGGSSFYSFTVLQTGSFTATLASLALPSQPAALAVPVRLGVGIPAGEGCAVTQSVDAVPGLTPQFTISLAPGTYCVNVSDIGMLPGDVAFALRFVHT